MLYLLPLYMNDFQKTLWEGFGQVLTCEKEYYFYVSKRVTFKNLILNDLYVSFYNKPRF